MIYLISYRLGIGPDGKHLPIPNTKRLYPRLYPCLIVNQDGSTYQIYHHYPYEIITLPLDPNTLTPEQREVYIPMVYSNVIIIVQAREKEKRQAQQPKYFSEDDYLEEEWDHTQYKDLLRQQ